MFWSNFSQFLPQIRIICLSFGHQLTEFDLSHLEESEEEVHERAGAGAAWVEFVDLLAKAFFHRGVYNTTAYWYHEIFIRGAYQNVQSALFTGLIQVIRDFTALKPVSIIDNMINYPFVWGICFAYFGDFYDFVGCPGCKTRCRAENTEDFGWSHILYSLANGLKVSWEWFTVDEGFYDERLEICRENALQACFLVDSRPYHILSIGLLTF